MSQLCVRFFVIDKNKAHNRKKTYSQQKMGNLQTNNNMGSICRDGEVEGGVPNLQEVKKSHVTWWSVIPPFVHMKKHYSGEGL